jgi:RNA polymerase sigma factor (sigma-70 family)
MGEQDPELVEFCRREHPRLVGALSLYCGDPDLAAEIAHDTLIRVVADWPRIRAMAAPGAWAHRVGMNLDSSWYRRRAAERRALERHAARGEHTDPDAADAVAVRQAVAALPDRQRRMVVLRFYAGLSLAEACAAVGVTEAAGAALTHRAVTALRGRIRDVEEV